MDSSDLTDAQLDALAAQLIPKLRWLNALVKRCDRDFPPSDPVYAAAMQAQNAMQSLRVAIHYARVRDGVGRSR